MELEQHRGNRRAVFPVEMFAVARKLAAGFETIRREAAALRPDEWLVWPERGAYSEGWYVYPFVMTTMPQGMTVDFPAHRARCPGSWALLADPHVVLAGLSRLLPGCHIYPHVDSPAFDVLRFHLGLENRGDAGMRVGGGTFEQQPSQSLVFDAACPHEAGNLGQAPRDVLLVDFRVTGAELDELQRLRTEFAAAAAAG